MRLQRLNEWCVHQIQRIVAQPVLGQMPGLLRQLAVRSASNLQDAVLEPDTSWTDRSARQQTQAVSPVAAAS